LDPENPVQYLEMGAHRVIQSIDVLFTPAGPLAS
jgi:hypothetical protein